MVHRMLTSLGVTVPARAEWRFAWVMAIIIAGAVGLPYVVGFVAALPHHSTGFGNMLNGDIPAYMDVMWQAREGHFLFNNGLTGEPNPQVLFRPFFLVLGWISGLTQLAPHIVWDIAVVLLAGLFVPVAYLLVAQFFDDRSTRRLALIVLLTAGGLGFMHFLPGDPWPHHVGVVPDPYDVGVPESNTFAALSNAAHFSYSLILLALIVIFLMRARKRPWLSAGVSALLAFLLISDHPYDAVILGLLVSLTVAHALLFYPETFRKALPVILGIVAGTALAALIVWQAVHRSDVVAEWNRINITPPGYWINFLAGYLPLFELAFVGLLANRKKPVVLFLTVWSITHLLLVWAPFIPFSRRLTEGAQFPLVLLAVFGIVAMFKRATGRYVVAALLATTAVVSVVRVTALQKSIFSEDRVRGFTTGPIHTYPDSYADALEWLRENTGDDEMVLASPANGTLITSFTGRQVIAGHAGQTVQFWAKNNHIADIFQGRASIDTIAVNFPITLVWIAREEQELMKQQGVTAEKLLPHTEPVFENQDVSIFRITQKYPALD
jgi:hypothetical protein